MKLTHVEVSDFKGVSSLAFDPGQVTVLTGRNNSGKTSLLEATEIGIDPTRIERHSERVESLIAAGAESAEITLEYESEGETGRREVEMWVPESVDEGALVADLVARHEFRSLSYRVASIVDGVESELGEETVLDLMGVVEKNVESGLREQWSDAVSTRSVALTVDDSSHTFLYVEQTPQGFVESVTTAAISEITAEIADATAIERSAVPENFGSMIESPLEALLRETLHDGHLFPDDPESIGTVGLRDDLALTAEDVDFGENGAAVRLSDIEEYLIDNGLVDNLDTLSLDQMVYEEDGEKYQVPYEFTGEGFKTLVGLLWELWADTPELLLLEEPETNMHPRYIHEFVHWFVDVVRDRDVQVFLTTHDIDAIRSFFDFVEPSQKAFLREEFRLVQMDRTLPESYDYDEAESLSKEMQTDLRGM
ncbi:AAA family ATPase [Halobaculum sp. MBLA0143]|uniref:AAA family ATPase n=1 Tax=Halobaculum sp. MBLA0143 TaxID=3079933 RepID=UPI003526B58C